MSKKSIIFFLFFTILAVAQNTMVTDPNKMTYSSRKGLYEIKYNKELWKKKESNSKWDAEFQDSYNLINAYFIEFDYFVTDKNLKSTLKEQYQKLGRIKNLKIYKKKINEMNVNYFMCELEYNNYKYIFQGFLYNGKGGTMEIQFGAQEEALMQNQRMIDEFCIGIKEIK